MNVKEFVALIEETNKRTGRPTRLGVGIFKVIYRSSGRDTRYFRLFLDGFDVTECAAKILRKPLSKSKDIRLSDCVLIHGSNMDMAFYMVHELRRLIRDKYGVLLDDDYTPV